MSTEQLSTPAEGASLGKTPPLPEGTRLLHIGPHKTGTTSLQNSIRANREEILRQGVYYGAPEGKLASNRIARSLLKMSFKRPGEVPGYEEWEDQVARVRTTTAKRVIVSGEEFSNCETKEIKTLIRDLDKERVHVVVTVRPLAKVLPSQWQLDLQGSFTVGSFDDWLRWTLKPTGLRGLAVALGIPHPFWFRHRHDQLVNRWAREVGAERVTVVVADDRDHRVLLRAFEAMLGLTDGTLLPVDGKSNPSLSVEEVAIILRTQEILMERGLIFAERVRSRQIQRRLLTQRPRDPNDSKIVIPEWAVESVREASQKIHDGLLASGVRIIGDPSLLLQANAPKAGQKGANHAEIEASAQQMVAELAADGKLQPGRKQGSAARALSRVARRLARRA
jgi:hypothetical protein